MRLLLLVLLLSPQYIFAWGKDGHRLVARVGSQLSISHTKFWSANEENMAKLTVVPDSVWKSLLTANIEKPTHFFQPDAYYSDISEFHLIPQSYKKAVKEFTEDFVTKNGTAVWRVPQFYDLALEALKSKNYTLALQMAGVMSHYVGDLAQPLHDTTNYDGQLTNQKGLHSYFESTNISAQNQNWLEGEVTKAAQALLKNKNFLKQIKGGNPQTTFLQVGRAYSELNYLLEIDKTHGRKGDGAKKQLRLAIVRMADGAATLAVLLDQLWVDAGLSSSMYGVSVGTPAWVQPEYVYSSDSKFTYADDDCDM